MKNNSHTNYKVQEAFNQYGEPEFIILEYCKVAELPEKEIRWCTEFDALGPKGLCLVEPGIVGFGTNSNASKYSKQKILKVFSMLYKGKYSIPKIASRTGVHKATIYDISRGHTHVWLLEQYPQQYCKMLTCDRKLTAIKLTKPRAIVSDSYGNEFTIGNVAEFCNRHFQNKNDKKHMAQVLTGARKQHKGYTLVRLL